MVVGGGGLGGVGGETSGASPTVPLATATATVTQSLVDVSAWRGLSAAPRRRGQLPGKPS